MLWLPHAAAPGWLRTSRSCSVQHTACNIQCNTQHAWLVRLRCAASERNAIEARLDPWVDALARNESAPLTVRTQRTHPDPRTVTLIDPVLLVPHTRAGRWAHVLCSVSLGSVQEVLQQMCKPLRPMWLHADDCAGSVALPSACVCRRRRRWSYGA